jgi:molecular chaperone DnaK
MKQLGTADLGHRAGDYFDQKLMRLSHNRFLEASKLSPEEAVIAFGLKDRYLEECERVKIELSKSPSDDLQIASAFRNNGRNLDVSHKILREDLEAEIQIDINDAISKVDKILDEARLTARDVDLVLLIGGSSRIPLLQQQMQERFGSRIVHVNNADTIIAEGAALVDYLGMHPVSARSLGVRLSDGSYYELFPEGTIAKPDVFRKTINFYCTDGRDGEAKLVLVEKTDGREVNSRILGIPVDRALPRRNGDCERVSVTLELDSDLILHVFGKAATKTNGVSASFHDLLFALDTHGARK